jgi:hypothetical protein
LSQLERNMNGATRILPALLLALLPLAGSGCSVMPVSIGTFTTAFDGWIPSGGRKLSEGEPRFHVELRPSMGGKVRKTFPLDRELVVQDALDLARATSRFAKMNVYIYRTDESGKKVKFGADFDAAKRRMKYETDYAVHAGDTIVVEEDTSNALTDSIDRMTGLKKSSR